MNDGASFHQKTFGVLLSSTNQQLPFVRKKLLLLSHYIVLTDCAAKSFFASIFSNEHRQSPFLIVGDLFICLHSYAQNAR